MPTSDTVWVIEDPKVKKTAREAVQVKPARLPRPLKSPAVSFSLSLLLWGAGQIYNRQLKLGFFFMLLMANFYLYLGLMVYYWESIAATLKLIGISNSQTLIFSAFFYLSGLLFWIGNAYQAYHRTSLMRTMAFQGVRRAFWPFLCSMIIPGWGQFLNAQTKKGFSLLTFSLMGLFAFPAFFFILYIWPTLDASADLFFFERILLFALILSPVILLVWIINIHDALKVCRDYIKKEPLKKRIEYAINKIRFQSWKRDLFPQMKPALMLSLFLIFFMILSYHCFPAKYYATELQDIQTQLSQQKMVLLPETISKIQKFLTL